MLLELAVPPDRKLAHFAHHPEQGVPRRKEEPLSLCRRRYGRVVMNTPGPLTPALGARGEGAHLGAEVWPFGVGACPAHVDKSEPEKQLQRRLPLPRVSNSNRRHARTRAGAYRTPCPNR